MSRMRWDTRTFRKMVEQRLVDRSEIVGKFVEEEARRRLLAIQEPRKGRQHHRRYVASLLDYEVEVERGGVRTRVGPRATSESRHFGLYIEIGSTVFPPAPYLRPAVFDNAGQIIGIFEG